MLDETWMKLSEWAKREGLGYQQARRIFHDGLQLRALGFEGRVLPTGTLMVRRVADSEPSQLDRIEAKLDTLLEVHTKQS